jgi:hypothetical protein
VATFPDPNDQSFDTGNAITVATTTGISCQGTGANQQQPADDNTGTGVDNANAAETQYNADGKEVTVIVETIPDKKILIDTGGPSLPIIGGAILAAGLVGLGIFLLRRT